MGIKTLWYAFGATWVLILSYAVTMSAWCVSEHSSIREQMLLIDKTQSIQMARVETELKQISATQMEIKQQMTSRR